MTSFSTAFSSIPSREALFSTPKSARTEVDGDVRSATGDIGGHHRGATRGSQKQGSATREAEMPAGLKMSVP